MKHHFGRDIVEHLKNSAADASTTMCIPVGKPIQYLLRPISTNPNSIDLDRVRNLTIWRNKYVNSFLTEFTATEERTCQWLTQTVRFNEGKILFILEDLTGRSFGYMGLDFINWQTGYGEADAIVRGEYAPPGTMKIALQTLLKWAREYLGLSELWVRVRSDNTALEFYRKVQFHEANRITLYRHELPESIAWIDRSIPNTRTIELVYMKYNNQNV